MRWPGYSEPVARAQPDYRGRGAAAHPAGARCEAFHRLQKLLSWVMQSNPSRRPALRVPTAVAITRVPVIAAPFLATARLGSVVRSLRRHRYRRYRRYLSALPSPRAAPTSSLSLRRYCPPTIPPPIVLLRRSRLAAWLFRRFTAQ